jgi:hypothetical protein
MGDLYLNIVESKNKESGGFERQSVIVFAEDLPSFLGEFDKSLKALERARRDQKKTSRRSGPEGEPERTPRNERNGRSKDRPARPGRSAGKPEDRRRMVVKKRDRE